jgi:hypothetical protein
MAAMMDMDAILSQLTRNSGNKKAAKAGGKKRRRVEDKKKKPRLGGKSKLQKTGGKTKVPAKAVLPASDHDRDGPEIGSGNGGFYFATPGSTSAAKAAAQEQQASRLVWRRSWPETFRLGTLLAPPHEGNDVCTAYSCPEGKEYGGICATCGASGALHELVPSVSRKRKAQSVGHSADSGSVANSAILAAAFAAVRNTRCAAGEVGELGNSEPKNDRRNLKVMAAVAAAAAKKVASLVRELAQMGALSAGGEVELCTEKSDKLVDAVSAWQGNPGASAGLSSVLELRMEIIMAADALFYRLFYVQQGTAPGRVNALGPVPTPPTYFCLVGLAADSGGGIMLGAAGKSALKVFYRTAANDTRSVMDTDLGMHEMPCTWADRSGGGSHHVEEDNPLLAIFRARRVETIRHLWATGWAKRNAKKCLAAVPRADILNSEFDCHQTVAADLLAQWRDSVRDMPASIFAYACPTEPALAQIAKLGRPVVEIGAGTGYWAELLRRRGVQVTAYDKTPPGVEGGFNEYHGLCQPYGSVVSGGPEMAQQRITSGKQTAALFLCYPPPGLPMAQQCLSQYTLSGGDRVIHVGEWQGLTGDVQFESSLLKDYVLEATVQLPRWGTDASDLTIWRRRTLGELANTLACLPVCSNEGCFKMARKRCRLARDMCYCGTECFDKHRKKRRVLLSTQMVNLQDQEGCDGSQDLDCKFESQDQFADLDCLASGTSSSGGGNHGKNRRKNQKNKNKKRHGAHSKK